MRTCVGSEKKGTAIFELSISTWWDYSYLLMWKKQIKRFQPNHPKYMQSYAIYTQINHSKFAASK